MGGIAALNRLACNGGTIPACGAEKAGHCNISLAVANGVTTPFSPEWVIDFERMSRAVRELV